MAQLTHILKYFTYLSDQPTKTILPASSATHRAIACDREAFWKMGCWTNEPNLTYGGRLIEGKWLVSVPHLTTLVGDVLERVHRDDVRGVVERCVAGHPHPFKCPYLNIYL